MVSLTKVSSQNLEKITETPILQYQGGMQVRSTYNYSNSTFNRRPPLFWQMNSNFNSVVLGVINVPLSITINNGGSSFRQSTNFNRIGLSPNYRAYKLHLGHRTLNFSEYTMAGNLFYGIGGEYEPMDHPLYFGFFYGRLSNPSRRRTTDEVGFTIPSYRRMAWGTKVGWRNKIHQLNLILFKAWDESDSIEEVDSLAINPEENLVLGFQHNVELGKIKWALDYAFSMHSRDKDADQVTLDQFTFINNLGSLFEPNVTSTYADALTTQVSYGHRSSRFNLKYRRVDPGFITHGSSFLINDFDDVSLNVGSSVNDLIQYDASFGVQRNNLNRESVLTIRRIIYRVASTFNFKRLTLALDYSNFNSSTNEVLTQTDILSDTLEFVQITRNGSFSISTELGDNENPWILRYQNMIQNIHSSERQPTNMINYNLSVLHKIHDWQVSAALLINQNLNPVARVLTVGPQASLQRNFKKGKYQVRVNVNELRSFNQSNLQFRTLNLGMLASMKVTKRQRMNFNFIYQQRKSFEMSRNDRNVRINLSYTYSLSGRWPKKRLNK
jgi:hypothetical protein